MGTRKETIKITADADGAIGAIDKTSKSAKLLAKETRAAAKEAREAAQKQKAYTDELKKTAAGALVLVAALVATAQKYMETDAAAGRLANAQKSVGATTAEVAAQTEVATHMLGRFGISTLESFNNLQKLTDASGDAGKAARDYTLALDVASQANIDLGAAVELVAKARKGEVEELKKLRGISKDQAQELGKITDESARADFAIRSLSAAYDGSAEANRGAIDEQKVFTAALNEGVVSVGDVTTAIGTAGSGLVGALAEMVGLTDDGASFLTTFTSGLGNFADGIREATQPVLDLVAAGGAVGAVFSGKSFATILSEADTQRALAEAARKKGVEERQQNEKKESSEDVAALIKAENERQAVKVAAEAAEKQRLAKEVADKERAAARASSDAASKRKQRAASDAANWKELLAEIDRDEKKDAADAAKAAELAEEMAFREEVARMKLRGEIRQALEAELNRGDSTDGEKELALEQFDVNEEALQREIDLRNKIAELILAGNDYEAENVRIMNSSLTASEKSLAFKDRDVKKQKELNESVKAYANAIGGAGKAIAGAFMGSDAAKRTSAAIDGAIASYQAVMALWNQDYPAAIGLTVAAGMAFAVAGGAGGGGGGGAKSKGTASAAGGGTPPPSSAEQTRGQSTNAPTSTTLILNLSTLSTVTPESGRALADGINRSVASTIGGRK